MLLSRQNELGPGGVHGLNHGSGGKNSAYSEGVIGDTGSISGSGSSRGGGNGNLQHFLRSILRNQRKC